MGEKRDNDFKVMEVVNESRFKSKRSKVREGTLCLIEF